MHDVREVGDSRQSAAIRLERRPGHSAKSRECVCTDRARARVLNEKNTSSCTIRASHLYLSYSETSSCLLLCLLCSYMKALIEETSSPADGCRIFSRKCWKLNVDPFGCCWRRRRRWRGGSCACRCFKRECSMLLGYSHYISTGIRDWKKKWKKGKEKETQQQCTVIQIT